MRDIVTIEGYTLDGGVLCYEHGHPFDDGTDDGAKPLFSTDEFGLGVCEVCHIPVECSWGPEEVDRATEMLRFGIDDIKEHGTIDGARFEYQRHLAEHLGWCNTPREGVGGGALVRTQHPMIVPSEELGLAVVWHGGITFNVHVLTGSTDGGAHEPIWGVGAEVDVFTAYGAASERPIMHEAYQHIVSWFEAQEQDREEE